jgi:hypothetical protein
MAILLTGSLNVESSSDYTESGDRFSSGSHNDTQSRDGTLTLMPNQTIDPCWSRLVDGIPGGDAHSRMFYDDGGEVLMFGWNASEVWSYNVGTNKWTQKDLPSPDFRFINNGNTQQVNMGYDSLLRQAIALVGYKDASYNNHQETWSYDVNGNSWINKNAAPALTSPRVECAMAFDPVNGLMVYFGGYTSTVPGRRNDTWVYDLSLNTWTEKTTSVHPSAREYCKMAYDTAKGEMVLFGGSGASTIYNDTWRYNCTTNVWTNVSPAVSPPPLSQYSIAYDQNIQRTVLFGGWSFSVGTMNYTNATWWYDSLNNTWTNKTASYGPAARCMAAMTYDKGNRACVLHGGTSSDSTQENILNDTWIYTGSNNTWEKRVYNSSSPSNRWESAIAYDSSNGVVVLYGGGEVNGNQYNGVLPVNDTWIYNVSSNKWTNKTQSFGPPALYGHAMVYEDLNKTVVLFGGYAPSIGYTSGMYRYNVSNDTWTVVSVTGNKPSARTRHAMAYDSHRKEIVLYGGKDFSEFNDTWIFNLTNNTWMRITPPTSPPKVCGKMVYDSRNKIMLFYAGDPEIWLFNTTSRNWTKKSLLNPPPGREYFSMVYDATGGFVVLFGGGVDTIHNDRGTRGYFNEVWIYNTTSNNWSKIANTTIQPRFGASMTYVSHNVDGCLVFGGFWTDALGDLWYLNLQSFWPKGDYTSARFDMNGTAYFSKLDWSAWTFESNSVRIQLRTADTENNLNQSKFLGPDGTGNTYYSMPNLTINGAHNGSRWLQYRAILNTSNCAKTPIINSVKISYNLIHQLTLSCPTGGENWTKTHKITWNASDPDRNILNFSIFLVNGTHDEPLASGLPNGTAEWSWNTLAIPNGTYRIKVVANDDDLEIPLTVEALSGNFTIFHNTLPMVTLLRPSNNETVRTHSTDLKWTGSDDDGDPLVYYVLLSNHSFNSTSLPGPVINTNASTYRLNNLTNATKYCWTVIPCDGKGNGSIPEIRSFFVDLPVINYPPAVTLLAPDDNVTANTSSIRLFWCGTDENNDPLTYSVLISNSPFNDSSPPMSLTTVVSSNYTLTNLFNGMTYYWSIKASDGLLISAIPHPRRITVRIPVVNHPPTALLVGPADGVSMNNSIIKLSWAGADPDHDPVTYFLLFAQSSFDPLVRPAPVFAVTADTFIYVRDLRDGNTYYWTVVPFDGIENGTPPSVWRFCIDLGTVPNHPPSSQLLSPPNGSIVNTSSTELIWNGSDPDGDGLFYFLIFSDHPLDMGASPHQQLLDSAGFELLNLTDGATYFWTVVPSDGKTNGTAAGPWRFTVRIGATNNPPRITSIPPDSAYIGEIFTYDVKAQDGDGDILLFSAASDFIGLGIDSSIGKMVWSPKPSQRGNRTITVNVTDGRGGFDEQAFTVMVLDRTPPYVKPGCSITFPVSGAKISKAVNVTGIATSGSSRIIRVEVQVDSGAWRTADGNVNWTFVIDTKKLADGQHDIQARAYDGMNYSEPVSVSVTVDNPRPKPVGKGFIPGLELLQAVAAIALVMAAASGNRRRQD